MQAYGNLAMQQAMQQIQQQQQQQQVCKVCRSLHPQFLSTQSCEGVRSVPVGERARLLVHVAPADVFSRCAPSPASASGCIYPELNVRLKIKRQCIAAGRLERRSFTAC